MENNINKEKLVIKKKEIRLYKPYEYQIPIHQACLDPNIFFITIIAGRHSGKTLTLINQSLYWVLNNNNVLVYWVSPNSAQSKKIYKQIINAIIESGTIKSNKEPAGDTEIVFKNKSIIKFRSAEQGDALRGEVIDMLICDEAAYMKQSTFDAVLFPMLKTKGKKVVLASTPKGKNWVYYNYLKGVNKQEKYKSFKFTSYANPKGHHVIEMAKNSIPEVLFKQEYMAEFVDSAAIFENIDELAVINKITEPVPGDNYWGGIDIGMKNDYTVITLINQNNEVVFYDRFTNLESPQLKERITNILNKFKPKKTYIELNNQGLPIFHDLKQIHKVQNLEGFETTAESKPRIINNLINTFASKKIKILNDEYFKEELRAFTMTVLNTGKIKFQAPSGFHDDVVISLAIAWESCTKNRFSGEYIFA